MKNDYKVDLKIDQYNLDKELVKQSQIFMKWAFDFAEAASKKESLKLKLDLIKAEQYSRIKKESKEKKTENAMNLLVLQSSKVKKAQREYLEMSRVERILAEAKSALKQKQKMLEALVQLRIQSYYSDPKIKVDHGLVDTIRSREDFSLPETKKQIQRSLKRRIRK